MIALVVPDSESTFPREWAPPFAVCDRDSPAVLNFCSFPLAPVSACTREMLSILSLSPRTVDDSSWMVLSMMPRASPSRVLSASFSSPPSSSPRSAPATSPVFGAACSAVSAGGSLEAVASWVLSWVLARGSVLSGGRARDSMIRSSGSLAVASGSCAYPLAIPVRPCTTPNALSDPCERSSPRKWRVASTSAAVCTVIAREPLCVTDTFSTPVD
mmetsp:Transcript_62301/g.142630  ORF Transcript_62301/g.142630 Transcript_62301/m.142630 type:complete len:215 (+) Transcript_62301:270-914(+)